MYLLPTCLLNIKYRLIYQTHNKTKLKVACAIIVKKETFKECRRNANIDGGGWVQWANWAQYKHTKQRLRGEMGKRVNNHIVCPLTR